MKNQTYCKNSVFRLMFLGLIFFAATAIFAQPGARRANGKIAFVSNRVGNQEIYVMSQDGTNQVRLTNNPGTDCFPAFSPDGGKIAFVSEINFGVFALKMMNSDGTNQTSVTPLDFSPSPYPWHEKWALSWSPDGGKIAFQSAGEIYKISVDSSNLVNLTNNPANDGQPSFSPDGLRIVFTSNRLETNARTIHIMKADGSDVQTFVSAVASGAFFYSPKWSPDGQKILYLVSDIYDYPYGALRYRNVSGGASVPVTDCAEDADWSPDGNMIVFWRCAGGFTPVGLSIMNIGGGSSVQIGDENDYQPDWQPLTA